MDTPLRMFKFDSRNCPYDISGMKSVKTWHGYKLNEQVKFLDTDSLPMMHNLDFPWTRGKIVGIGINARYNTGVPVTLFAIEVVKENETIVYKTHEDICPILE